MHANCSYVQGQAATASRPGVAPRRLLPIRVAQQGPPQRRDRGAPPLALDCFRRPHLHHQLQQPLPRSCHHLWVRRIRSPSLSPASTCRPRTSTSSGCGHGLCCMCLHMKRSYRGCGEEDGYRHRRHSHIVAMLRRALHQRQHGPEAPLPRPGAWPLRPWVVPRRPLAAMLHTAPHQRQPGLRRRSEVPLPLPAAWPLPPRVGPHRPWAGLHGPPPASAAGLAPSLRGAYAGTTRRSGQLSFPRASADPASAERAAVDNVLV
mmetsp:Transcript_130120/g.278017  ORF Transcript_130120/g.278017 Transcript_130120/m.278017 type:complete len:262 (-) Transcript_130120:110-895(-)